MPRYIHARKRAVEPEEVAASLQASGDPMARALVAVLYLTGARVSEAIQLRRKDVEVGEDEVVFSIPTLKRRVSPPPVRRVFVSRSAPFLDHVLSYIGGLQPEEPLFPVSRKKAWELLRAMNPTWSPHLFRHTRATRLALRGAEVFELMDFFGWKTAGVATEYVQLAGKFAKRLRDKID